MHFFVKVTENRPLTTMDQAATANHRLESLDYLAALYAQKKLGFFFRSKDGSISYELHRTDSLQELDARLKANPQWPYASHEVVPVTKTGDMVSELMAYLKLDPQQFFADALARYHAAGLMQATHVASISSRVAAAGGDFLSLMSADEEEIDPEGNYTVVEKASKETAASVSPKYLEDMWLRTLRSQVAHLNSDVELVDYNPVGRSAGLLIGKGDLVDLQRHIESTEIYPDTIVTYFPVNTPKLAGLQAIDTLSRLRRSAPTLSHLKLY